jgi:hypothetical protein
MKLEPGDVFACNCTSRCDGRGVVAEDGGYWILSRINGDGWSKIHRHEASRIRFAEHPDPDSVIAEFTAAQLLGELVP